MAGSTLVTYTPATDIKVAPTGGETRDWRLSVTMGDTMLYLTEADARMLSAELSNVLASLPKGGE